MYTKKQPDAKILEICKQTLYALVAVQGREINLESGEEPGKFIHEYRPNNYERLINRPRPWYVYPDGQLRNYDSIDSTPLTLIALYRYYEITQDKTFLFSVLSAVEAGLNWIITYGDRDKDLLIEYELPQTRKSGGLEVQSWTDSAHSLLTKSGHMPKYPIAPVEVQAFTWLALTLWSQFYQTHYPTFGNKIKRFATDMKQVFSAQFGMEKKTDSLILLRHWMEINSKLKLSQPIRYSLCGQRTRIAKRKM